MSYNPHPFQREMSLIRRLLYPMSDDDIQSEREKELKDDFERGGGSSRPKGPESGKRARSDQWYDDIDQQVDENTAMTYSNNKRIAVIDERTAIMMRIMLGTLLAVGGGVAVWLITEVAL